MTETHVITDLPKNNLPKPPRKWVAVGLIAAGALLVVDDLVKKFSKDDETTESPDED